MFDLQKVDDLLLDEIAVVDLLLGRPAPIKSAPENPGLEMDVAAQANVVQNAHSAEHLHFLKRPGHAQPRSAGKASGG